MAPESGTGNLAEATADGDPVAEFGRALVVDLSAGDDGENAGVQHSGEVHAELSGKASAAGFDHPQVGDIMDDLSAVGIEKHHFFAGFDAWVAG